MAAYAYIDVSQKQEFIYKRNKLKDNLHHSFIIKSVTEKLEGLDSKQTKVSLSGYLEKHCRDQSEVVYSGGGNSIIRFPSLEQGQAFVRGYSREILEDYPQLELYISLVDESEVNGCGDGQEKKIREKLYQKADQLKDKRRARFRRWTYGVEKIDETGQAERSKEETDRDGKLARKYLQQSLEQKLQGTSITITSELQDYKKGDEGKSYIGVIALDGNKMGEMIQQIPTFQELAVFSREVETIYETALVDALKDYDEARPSDPQTGKRPPLYITPILMAGDDICLVVEAEHALEIAAQILKNIKTVSAIKKQKSLHNTWLSEDYLSACAGVAIARYTYPFFETVKAAEALCQRAKEMPHKVKGRESGAQRASFINWEILQGQVAASQAYEDFVKHGRDREFFHIKPLCVDQEQAVMEDGIFSYDAFRKLVQKIGEEKEISSSLLEDLKKNLYSGWEQYQLFFKTRLGSQKLVETVQAVLDGDTACRYAARVVKDGNVPTYTYILNDVLDALPFILCQEVK